MTFLYKCCIIVSFRYGALIWYKKCLQHNEMLWAKHLVSFIIEIAPLHNFKMKKFYKKILFMLLITIYNIFNSCLKEKNFNKFCSRLPWLSQNVIFRTYLIIWIINIPNEAKVFKISYWIAVYNFFNCILICKLMGRVILQFSFLQCVSDFCRINFCCCFFFF